MEIADLEEMKRSVHKLCLLHEAEAEDAAFFFDPELKYEWSDVELEEKNIKNMDSQPLEHTGILTESEKDMVLDCMRLMLKSRNLDASVDGVLMKVGQYYQADRVYISVDAGTSAGGKRRKNFLAVRDSSDGEIRRGRTDFLY